MKFISLLLSGLLLAACNAGYDPRYYYNSIEIANLSGADISNVELLIGERELKCATVARNALCQERFGKRPYPKQAMQLGWQDGSGNQQMQRPNPPVPVTMTPAWPLRLQLDIQPDGSVKAKFRQESINL